MMVLPWLPPELTSPRAMVPPLASEEATPPFPAAASPPSPMIPPLPPTATLPSPPSAEETAVPPSALMSRVVSLLTVPPSTATLPPAVPPPPPFASPPPRRGVPRPPAASVVGFLFFFYGPPAPRHLPSFPPRGSPDLDGVALVAAGVDIAEGDRPAVGFGRGHPAISGRGIAAVPDDPAVAPDRHVAVAAVRRGDRRAAVGTDVEGRLVADRAPVDRHVAPRGAPPPPFCLPPPPQGRPPSPRRLCCGVSFFFLRSPRPPPSSLLPSPGLPGP